MVAHRRWGSELVEPAPTENCGNSPQGADAVDVVTIIWAGDRLGSVASREEAWTKSSSWRWTGRLGGCWNETSPTRWRISDGSLALSFGWTDPTWYTEKTKLQELYEFIAAQGSQLSYELDQATDDPNRELWLGAVIDSKAPPEPGLAERESVVPTRASAPLSNGATPRKSAFGPKSQPEASNGAPVETTAAAPNAAAPGRKSIFKANSQPEPAAEGSAHSSGATPDHEVPIDEHLVEVDQQIQAVMSDLPADVLAAIASELGLSPEEVEAMVQEPDFAALVAEEQVHAGSSA